MYYCTTRKSVIYGNRSICLTGLSLLLGQIIINSIFIPINSFNEEDLCTYQKLVGIVVPWGNILI